MFVELVNSLDEWLTLIRRLDHGRAVLAETAASTTDDATTTAVLTKTMHVIRFLSEFSDSY